MRLAAASLILIAAATPAYAIEPGLVQIGLGVGIGTSYSFAGVRLEVDVDHFGVFGALGLPMIAPEVLVGLAQDEIGISTSDPSFHGNGGGTFGLRYFAERGGCGIFLSAQLSILTFGYRSDGGGAPQSGRFDTLTAVIGYRKRWGYFFAEGGVGLGVLLLGSNLPSDDGSAQPYRTSSWPMPDVSIGIGVLIW